MKKISVVWKSYNPDSPSRGYWDQGLLYDLLSNKLWQPAMGFEFDHSESFDSVDDGAILVIPARSNVDYIHEINKDIQKLDWVILMLTGDEENIFPIENIVHHNIKLYIMSPREDLDLNNCRVLGTGYPPQIHDFLDNEEAPDKDVNWMFAGQVTHGRRVECAEALRDFHLPGFLFESEGFTQGLGHEAYYSGMARAKVAPCPSGPETPDTFRLFEALEVGAIPVADTRVSKGGFSDNYWTFFFGEQPPFPTIVDYSNLHGYIEDQLDRYPAKNNRVYAWWQAKKRQMSYVLNNDIAELSKTMPHDNRSPSNSITAIIPVSPIKSHPDTKILEETINSIRHHLPTCEIIVTFDGVRKEQEDRRSDYEEFIRKMLWKFNFKYKNILPVIFDDHSHQTGMAKAIIDEIKTPLIIYVEQDTPLVTDCDIPFNSLQYVVKNGTSDCIRLHHEAIIPKEHSHMMLGMENETDDPLMRTCQWSQRPHVSSVAFYRRILNTCFSGEAKSFIEDKMHGVAHSAYIDDGIMGWEQYKIHIYHPNNNIKRSYHTDGRDGEPKYDDTQEF